MSETTAIENTAPPKPETQEEYVITVTVTKRTLELRSPKAEYQYEAGAYVQPPDRWMEREGKVFEQKVYGQLDLKAVVAAVNGLSHDTESSSNTP